MRDGAREGTTGEQLAAAIDETVAETRALIAALHAMGGARERRIAGQLALTMASLAAARDHLVYGRHTLSRTGPER